MRRTVARGIPVNQAGLWIVAFLSLAILAGILTVQFSWLTLGAAGVVLLVLALLVHPGWVLLLFLLYIWLFAGRSDPGDLLEAYPMVRWGTYLLIPALAALAMTRASVRGYWRKSLVELFIALVTGIILCSAFINDTGLTEVAFSIGIYLRYPLLFLLLVNLDLRQVDYARALRLFLVISLLLMVEAILNYTLFGKHGDATFFTLGVSHGHVNANLFFVYGLCFLMAHALRTRVRFYHLLVVALVLIGGRIADIRSLLLFVPPLFILLYGVNRRYLGRLRITILAITLLVILGAAIFFPWYELLVRIPSIVQYHYFYPGYRFETTKQALHILAESNKLLFGLGPRSYSPGTIGSPGVMFQILLSQFGSLYALGTANQFTTSLSEIGVAGFIAHWIMLMVVLGMNLQFWRSCSCSSNSAQEIGWSIVSLAFFGIWFHYALLGIAFYDLWRIDISSLLFWTCAAAIYSEGRRRGIFAVHRDQKSRSLLKQ